jgi:beta-lactamase superfamily II metal-dependent hydrolase
VQSVTRILIAALLLLGAQNKRGLEIHWIDVEGGAATLVVTPKGESLLMDTGFPGARDAGRIAQTLKAAGVRRIDHLLISHWHLDHVGGVADLVKLVPVGKFYDHGIVADGPKDFDPKHKEAYLRITGGKSVTLKAGDAIPLDGVKLHVLCSDTLTPGEPAASPQTRACDRHPAKPDDTTDNARSLGWLLSFGDFDFLDLGDVTWNVEHKLVCPKNLIGGVDVYQVTHHGQDNSNNPDLVRAVQPTVAIFNNGPKKGGKAAVYKILRETPSVKDIFQAHRNIETGPGDNAPAEFVANDDAACKGEGIRLAVDPAGKSYTVEIPSKGTKRTYASK